MADRDAAGVAPVPVRVIDCGESPAWSVMTMAAVIGPVAVGAKCP